MKVDVIGSNSLLFANLPPASQVPGRTYRVSDVGPAPGILLTSNGTIWRPANGRAVLANYNTPDLTVQNTSETIFTTVGPFPGGLIKQGMRLNLDLKYNTPAISSAVRYVLARIGASGSGVSAQLLSNGASGASGAIRVNRTLNYLLVKSSTSAAHVSTANYSTGLFYDYNGGGGDGFSPVVDFSAPWELNITGTSCNETATTIAAASWAAGVVTFTDTAHTLAVGDKTTVAGVTPSGYNGVYVVTTVANANTFTVALASNPGAYTSGGTSSRISNVVLQSYILEVVG